MSTAISTVIRGTHMRTIVGKCYEAIKTVPMKVESHNPLTCQWMHPLHKELPVLLAEPLYHCSLDFFLQFKWMNFTFMGPCIVNVNVFKCNQQDARLHNDDYYYKRSTCFRRFLRPSSGAQNCIHSVGYLSRFYCLLPQAYSFELLMMGRGTTWNM